MTPQEIDPSAIDVRLPTSELAYVAHRPADDLRRDLGIMTDYELANALEVTTTTLASWRRDGIGPRPTKLGKSVFYRYEDVADWIKYGGNDGGRAEN